MFEGLVSVTVILRTVTVSARTAQRRDVTDLIDQIEEVRPSLGDPIQAVAQRDGGGKQRRIRKESIRQLRKRRTWI
jgi:hypothetical protein